MGYTDKDKGLKGQEGDEDMNLSEKIIVERKKMGLSQEQLADRLGITRQAVSKWESGMAIPETVKLVALSEMFHVSVDYLVKDYIEEDVLWQEREAFGQMESGSASRLEEKVDRLERYLRGFQYTSKTKIKGIPLVSIRFSRSLGRDGVAKGIFAMGNIAVGVVAVGALSAGVISFGAVCAGILAIGALAIGVVSWGALAVGILAFGSVAAGVYSMGAAAYGSEIAVGVAAAGKTVIGESVKGVNCLQWYEGMSKEEIRKFLIEYHPNLWGPLRNAFIMFGAHIC